MIKKNKSYKSKTNRSKIYKSKSRKSRKPRSYKSKSRKYESVFEKYPLPIKLNRKVEI